MYSRMADEVVVVKKFRETLDLKPIIIDLIRQDMLWHRFLNDIESIGLHYEGELELCEPVIRLIGGKRRGG